LKLPEALKGQAAKSRRIAMRRDLQTTPVSRARFGLHSLKRFLELATIALCIVAVNGAFAQDAVDLRVSRVTPVPTNEHHNGKLVWVDLVTTNTDKAVQFYTDAFGWQAKYFDDENFVEMVHDGQVICSIVGYEPGVAEDGDARWLVSVSVDNVDAAADLARQYGGEILEPATDLPGRGRYSVVSDPQGAVLMLLRATGGDPADSKQRVVLNEWGWAELWTDDQAGAVAFYKKVVGYGSLKVTDPDGDERIVLGSDGMPRATVVQLPWDDVEPNWIPYIPVASLETTLQNISDAAGAVLVRSDESEDEGPAAIVMDPTGGVFAIQEVRSKQ
jgi:predicted enzyme related to lactoylglutathione lyase